MKLLNYRYKEKITFPHKQKSELDEVLHVEFDARKKLINIYKAKGKEIMMEKR